MELFPQPPFWLIRQIRSDMGLPFALPPDCPWQFHARRQNHSENRLTKRPRSSTKNRTPVVRPPGEESGFPLDPVVLGVQTEVIASRDRVRPVSQNRRAADSLESEPATGIGQLTLAEHSLCPLHTAVSLQPHLVHETEFFYMGSGRQVCKGHARVSCPLGLLANDELFLWGLLGLTLAQPKADGQLYATPHYCLRQLGLIDQKSRRGGRQYRQFADALERLSVVSYQNDAFYDPLRKEHRKVSFRFLSYSLPMDPGSTRVWRIVWDPLFFELIQPTGGHLVFDLEAYRGLDPASRRLFLLLSKMFWRRTTTPRFELRHLGVDVLGFSPELADSELRKKLTRCIDRLAQIGAVETSDGLFQSAQRHCTLRLTRGPYFRRERRRDTPLSVQESALFEPLRTIGFEERSIAWLLREFPVTVLRAELA